MQTIRANSSGVIDNVTIPLVPGRYAIAYQAATTSGYALTAGTLTFEVQHNQPARLETAVATQATAEFIAGANYTIYALQNGDLAGAAGNQATWQAIANPADPSTPHYAPDPFPHATIPASLARTREAQFELTFDSANEIHINGTSITDEDAAVIDLPILLKRYGTVNGYRAYSENGTDADGQAKIFVKAESTRAASWVFTNDPVGAPLTGTFEFILGYQSLAVFPLDSLPIIPPPDLLEPSDARGSITAGEDTDYFGPTLEKVGVTVGNSMGITIDDISPADGVIFPTDITPLTGGADATIAEEILRIPVQTVAGDDVSLSLATASNRLGNYEFTVTEASKLRVGLTGGTANGALHVSVTPLNP